MKGAYQERQRCNLLPTARQAAKRCVWNDRGVSKRRITDSKARRNRVCPERQGRDRTTSWRPLTHSKAKDEEGVSRMSPEQLTSPALKRTGLTRRAKVLASRTSYNP